MSEREQVARAAGILTVAMILSRILGYVRDLALYAQFGQNRVTDAYNAAFSIPDFIYMILVGGALSSAFIPVFGGYVATAREEEGWYVASSLLNLIILLLLFGITLGFIFTPQLIRILVPGFSDREIELTVHLTRIMFVQTFFMGLSGVTTGILNSYKHFTAPALGSVLYNLTIIAVGWNLAPYLGITAYSLGVVGGAVLNFAVQIPPLLRLGLRYRPVLDLRHPGIKQIGVLVFPVLVGLSASQFNLFVSQNLASELPGGLLAALRTAQRLMQVPIGIFAVAIGTAVFPTLTSQAARKEWDQFRRTASLGLRTVNFLTLPATAFLIALGVPLIRLLFEAGRFTPENTQATAVALFYYSFGIVGYSGALVLNRVFYALKDTKTPVIVGVVTVFLNIVLNILLIRVLGHGGLALAYSVVGIVNMIVLLVVLRWKVGALGGSRILYSGAGAFLSSVFVAVFSYAVVGRVEGILGTASKLSQLVAVGAGVFTGIILYLALAYLLHLEELQLIFDLIQKRLRHNRGR
ncbi:MAG: Virulence factor MviN [Thermoanaerobacterales bacterium 50_218]|nr:MAG: Virulence factor MviN [Thermoanaerobacterales bacterium 50_218]HAA89622.1 murein biosynthesis integral membrane protein MurJ [Peptococcaceae bacterium]